MRLLRRLLPLLLLLTGLSLRGAPESPPFRWQADIRDGRLTVAVEVADACYLYVSATSVAAEAAGTVVSPWREPEATEKYDEFFGRPERIYGAGRHEWSAPVDPAAAPFTVTVEYQGCRGKSSAGPAVCFMPETLQLTVEPGKDAAAVKSVGAAGDQEVADAEPDEAAGIGSFRIVRHAEGLMGVPEFLAFLRNDSEPTGGGTGGWAAGGFWAMILLALLGGLGLNLTPCVLPMIPVNLAIIGADGANWRTGAWGDVVSAGSGRRAAGGRLCGSGADCGNRFFRQLVCGREFRRAAAAVCTGDRDGVAVAFRWRRDGRSAETGAMDGTDQGGIRSDHSAGGGILRLSGVHPPAGPV